MDVSNYKKIRISIYNVKAGMIAASDIFTSQGQLLVSMNSQITDSIIEKLNFYTIPFIRIYAKDEATQNKAVTETMDMNESHSTHSQSIKNSKKFQDFKFEFNSCINEVNQSLQHIINNSRDINIGRLLSQTTNLLASSDTSMGVLDMLSNMRDYDDSTYAHSLNVAIICRIFGQWLRLPPHDLDVLTVAGLLHDLGKLLISQDIIKKPGRLSESEFKIVQMHPQLGYDKLKLLNIDNRIKNAALLHHEKCDGSGYPFGLTIERIDPFARILTIADVYDAMTANRVYRKGMCPFHVIEMFEHDGFQKYDVQFLVPFLNGIVQTYLHNHVCLNDGRTGEIIMINPAKLSRPLVQLSSGFVDLSKETKLKIEKIL